MSALTVAVGLRVVAPLLRLLLTKTRKRRKRTLAGVGLAMPAPFNSGTKRSRACRHQLNGDRSTG